MLDRIRPTAHTLVKWREDYGYSQQDLANHLQKPLEQILRWEDGSEKIPFIIYFSLHDPDFIW